MATMHLLIEISRNTHTV